GFPRNIDQAKALENLLEEIGQPLDAVLLLDVRRETLVKRLAGRRVCPKCGAVYNVHSMPPGATGCAKDGAELQQRPDDKEEVVAKRLEVYEHQTRPLVEHYSQSGLLRVVAGEGELEEVFERLESAALARAVPADKLSVTRAREARQASAATQRQSQTGRDVCAEDEKDPRDQDEEDVGLEQEEGGGKSREAEIRKACGESEEDGKE